MSIRNKILLYFSVSTSLLTGVTLCIIYWLFAAYREEEFQQQQNAKIHATIKLLDRYQKESEEISHLMDAQTIHDFYDEKLLIYDNNKQLIFSSLDDLDINKRKAILNELSVSNQWIETKEGEYDLVGVYLEDGKKSYYAISKAYDALGYSKLAYLKKVLIILFVIILFCVLLVSIYIANNLSRPINKLTSLLKGYNVNDVHAKPLINETSTKELQYLTQHFNELLHRTREVFTFQKNIIHHISHQLKTPIAVLVSELEKIECKETNAMLKKELDIQIQRAKSLGDIIATLLEISKMESDKKMPLLPVRVDELLFDLIEQFKIIDPGFSFQINFDPDIFFEKQLEVKGHKLLLQQAFENLFHNCLLYSSHQQANITINTRESGKLILTLTNKGDTIQADEYGLLFQYFFRGKNSRGKSGNGLGLILVQKIIQLHGGTITYSSKHQENTFEIILPL